MTTDLPTVLAGLQEYRAKIDLAIGALQDLLPARNGSAATAVQELVAPERKRLAAGKPAGRRPKAAANGKKSKTDWELGRKLWMEGVPTVEIAKRLGVCRAAPLYRAKVDKWPKREAPRVNPEPAATPAPVAIAAPVSEPVKQLKPIAVARPAAPKKEKEGKVALRRCDTCGQVTDKDPCSKCGAKMQEWRSVFS